MDFFLNPSSYNLSLSGNRKRKKLANSASLKVKSFEHNLSSRTTKNLIVTLTGQIIKSALHLVSLIVLSRLLEPSDFGIVATATVAIHFAKVFSEPGLVFATIQAPKIRSREVATLFYLNVLIGFVIAAISIFFAPLYSTMVDEPILKPVIQVLAILFIINGLAAQSDAVLRRRMMFKTIVIVDVSASTVAVLLTVVLAYNGAGYWALIIQLMTAAVIRLICLVCVSPWKPWPFERPTNVEKLFTFGVKLVFGNLLNALSSGMTPIFVKTVSGLSGVGLWERSSTLSSLPNKQITPALFSVLNPALARLSKNKNRFEQVLVQGLKRVSLVSAFVSIQLFISAEDLSFVLLGSGWEETTNLIKIFAFYCLTEPLSVLLATSLVAAGYPGALLKWRMFSAASLVVAFLIGMHWGLIGLAIAFSSVNALVRFPLFLTYVSKKVLLSVSNITTAPITGIIAFVYVATCFEFIVPTVKFVPLMNVITNAVISSFLFLSIVLFIPSVRKDFQSLFYFLNRNFPKFSK